MTPHVTLLKSNENDKNTMQGHLLISSYLILIFDK